MHRGGDNGNVTLLHQSSLQRMQSAPSLNCHQKERNIIFSVIFEAETMWANRRMQL